VLAGIEKNFEKPSSRQPEIPNRNRMNTSIKSVGHYDDIQTNNQETDRQK
jgi:hypothetical protein